MISKVSVIHKDTREESIFSALQLIKEDIRKKISRKRHVLVKPNLGFINRSLANTHVEAVETLLKFLREFYHRPIVIAEGSTIGLTNRAYLEYGYEKLVDKYNVELIDLNEENDFEVFRIFDGALRENISIKVSKRILNSDFLISICPMKTHDSVIVTLGIKNVVVGSIRKKDRVKIHQGSQAINLTLAKLAKKLLPDLVILDGYEAMEGDGPVSGDRVNFKIAIASLDAVAADAIGAALMGFDPSDIGYLQYCHQLKLGIADPLKIVNLGNNYKKLVRRFKPHHSYRLQLDWRL